jgi:hypothetical protein
MNDMLLKSTLVARIRVISSLQSPVTRQIITKKLLPAPQIKSLIERLIANDAILDKVVVSAWNEKVEQQKKEEALVKQAEGGDAEAMFSLGVSYAFGRQGFKKDPKLGFSWFTRALRS